MSATKAKEQDPEQRIGSRVTYSSKKAVHLPKEYTDAQEVELAYRRADRWARNPGEPYGAAE